GQAADHVPLRALPGDGPSQPGDHPGRAEEPVAAGAGARRIRRALRVREAAVGAARARALRIVGRTDAAVGQDAHGRSAASGDPLPGRHADGRRLFERRRERLREPHADRQPAREELPGDLALGGGAYAAGADCRARLLLHERDLPLAELHLPPGAVDQGDGGVEAVATAVRTSFGPTLASIAAMTGSRRARS